MSITISSVINNVAFPIMDIGISPSNNCDSKPYSSDANKVIIPDLFVSFISQRPKPNRYYEEVKGQSKEWMKEYVKRCFWSSLRLNLTGCVIGMSVSTESIGGQISHTLLLYGQRRLARRSSELLSIGATGR